MTKATKSVLLLGGKPFDPNPPSPLMVRLREYLDSTPDNEIFFIEEVAKRIKASRHSLHLLFRDERLTEYCQIAGRNKYCGNPAAIRELRKRVGQ